jgi:predicted AAA+ superfamily ATPase
MMNKARAKQHLFDLRSLSVFSAIRGDPVVTSIDRLFVALASAPIPETIDAEAGSDRRLAIAESWASFAGDLASVALPLRAWFASLTAADENAFTLAAEKGRIAAVSAGLAAAAAADLARLGRIATLDVAALGGAVAGFLREEGLIDAADRVESEAAALSAERGASVLGAEVHPAAAVLLAASEWEVALPHFAQAVRVSGAGPLGIHRSFIWNVRNGDAKKIRTALLPVLHPDPIRLADLSGYEEQRSVVVSNTLRFLEGKAANNLLLYGDRGTGKSATVKAICNEYAGRSLRLIEVRKEALSRFSEILEALADRASRFVVFVDDLTFEKTDDAYTGLKALLEGGAEARPDNVVVYATSNRRHLVKERLADRPTTAAAALAADTGDVRAFDSMQEQLSLADRFGVTVVYSSPSQDEYLRIAEFIAESRGLLAPAPVAAAPGAASATAAAARRERFRADALRWERWFNGRSPRTARQYVDWLEGGEGFPWE